MAFISICVKTIKVEYPSVSYIHDIQNMSTSTFISISSQFQWWTASMCELMLVKVSRELQAASSPCSVSWSGGDERTLVFAWSQCHLQKVDETIWWTGNVIYCRLSCVDGENGRARGEEEPRVLPCVRKHEIALYSWTWRRFHRPSHVCWTEDIDVRHRDCLGFICHYSRHIGSGRRNRVSKFL